MPENLSESFPSIALRVAVAAGALVVGLIVASLARRFVTRLMRRPRMVQALGPSMRQVLVRSTYAVLLVLVIVAVLLILGVPDQVVVVGLGTAIVILGLALHQSLANFAATVIFLIFQPFKLGDDIETMGVRGFVEDIQLFNTVIRLFDHRLASLPNGKIQEAGVINFSKSGLICATVRVIVGYDQDIDRVRELTSEVLAADLRVVTDPAPEIVVTELTAEGMWLEVRPTVRYPDWWPVLTDLHQAIPDRLRAGGIRLAVAPETQVRVVDISGEPGLDGAAPPPAASATE